jgi:hypothetical protein
MYYIVYHYTAVHQVSCLLLSIFHYFGLFAEEMSKGFI